MAGQLAALWPLHALHPPSQAIKKMSKTNAKSLTAMKQNLKKKMLERENYRGAIELFSEGCSLNPSPFLFTHRALAYKALNLWQEAYYEYSYAIRMEPTNGGFFCNRGMCAAKLMRISLALADLE